MQSILEIVLQLVLKYRKTIMVLYFIFPILLFLPPLVSLIDKNRFTMV